ncbi:MAG: SPW repeat protein [Reyranella sp.]
MTELKWRQDAIDIGSLVLAVVLGVTPWVLEFTTNEVMAANAWISALAIAVVAIEALTRTAEWEEWINLVLGLWVAVSPWVLNFAGHEAARWTHVVIGLIVAALAGVTLWHTHQTPPHAAAGH